MCSIPPSCENPDDSYVTIFHPVVSDARVLDPSHIKRFSMKMFTFTKDEEVLKDEVKYELIPKMRVLPSSHSSPVMNPSVRLQIFVHCDVEICDAHSQADGSCRGQCVKPAHQMNYRRERKRGK